MTQDQWNKADKAFMENLDDKFNRIGNQSGGSTSAQTPPPVGRAGSLPELAQAGSPTFISNVEWAELRDILNLPSTDDDKTLVIREIKELMRDREEFIQRMSGLRRNLEAIQFKLSVSPKPQTQRK